MSRTTLRVGWNRDPDGVEELKGRRDLREGMPDPEILAHVVFSVKAEVVDNRDPPKTMNGAKSWMDPLDYEMAEALYAAFERNTWIESLEFDAGARSLGFREELFLPAVVGNRKCYVPAVDGVAAGRIRGAKAEELVTEETVGTRLTYERSEGGKWRDVEVARFELERSSGRLTLELDGAELSLARMRSFVGAAARGGRRLDRPFGGVRELGETPPARRLTVVVRNSTSLFDWEVPEDEKEAESGARDVPFDLRRTIFGEFPDALSLETVVCLQSGETCTADRRDELRFRLVDVPSADDEDSASADSQGSVDEESWKIKVLRPTTRAEDASHADEPRVFSLAEVNAVFEGLANERWGPAVRVRGLEGLDRFRVESLWRSIPHAKSWSWRRFAWAGTDFPYRSEISQRRLSALASLIASHV